MATRVLVLIRLVQGLGHAEYSDGLLARSPLKYRARIGPLPCTSTMPRSTNSKKCRIRWQVTVQTWMLTVSAIVSMREARFKASAQTS